MNQMSFMDAVQSVLTNYVNFSGRARRKEYWYFFVFNMLASAVLNIIGIKFLAYIYSLALICPGLAVAIRRLHDTGKSAWYILLNLIPLLGTIAFLVFLCQEGTHGPNQYGSDPKYN